MVLRYLKCTFWIFSTSFTLGQLIPVIFEGISGCGMSWAVTKVPLSCNEMPVLCTPQDVCCCIEVAAMPLRLHSTGLVISNFFTFLYFSPVFSFFALY